MMDEEWAAKMHVCGQSERLWEALSANRQDDEVCMSLGRLTADNRSHFAPVFSYVRLDPDRPRCHLVEISRRLCGTLPESDKTRRALGDS